MQGVPIIVFWLIWFAFVPICQAHDHPEHENFTVAEIPWYQLEFNPKAIECHSILVKEPDNLSAAVGLCQELIRFSRHESDPTFMRYARAVLNPWWSDADPPLEIVVLRGTIRQYHHDFATALADMEQAVKKEPRHVSAWLSMAMIHSAQGNYSKAKQCASRLLTIAPRRISTTCISFIGSQTGNARKSLKILQQMQTMDQDISLTDEERWTVLVTADIASRLGEVELAQKSYQALLRSNPSDAEARLAFCDFLLDQNQPETVVELVQSQKTNTAHLLRLALAQKQLNRKRDLKKSVKNLDETFEDTEHHGEHVSLRDQTRYLLYLKKRPEEALICALKNWNIHKEPLDARLVLESAIAADRRPAAAEVREFILSNRLEDLQLQQLLKTLK